MSGTRTQEETSITVLYVDDQSDFAEVVALRLEEKDRRFSVLTEECGQRGLEIVESEPIDCIVSDYQMPEMDGLTFLERVRDTYPTLPFILFTGQGSEDIAAEAINSGVDAYVQKKTGNGQMTVLSQHITTLVDKYRTEHQLARFVSHGDGREPEDTPSPEPPTWQERTGDWRKSVGVTVVEAVAEREGTDPTSLAPPLNEVIDTDALDSLFHRQEKAATPIDSVSFTYCGYTVTVTGERQIMLDQC